MPRPIADPSTGRHRQGIRRDEATEASDGSKVGPGRDPLDMAHRPRDARPTQHEPTATCPHHTSRHGGPAAGKAR